MDQAKTLQDITLERFRRIHQVLSRLPAEISHPPFGEPKAQGEFAAPDEARAEMKSLAAEAIGLGLLVSAGLLSAEAAYAGEP